LKYKYRLFRKKRKTEEEVMKELTIDSNRDKSSLHKKRRRRRKVFQMENLAKRKKLKIKEQKEP